MKNITHEAYIKATIRLNELIEVVTDETPDIDPLALEFIEVTSIIEAYEKIHFPIGLPDLIEVIELRMFEMKLNQTTLAKLLGSSTSRISEYLNRKREFPLDIAKKLHLKLNIDSDIILQ
jgi:HTH-type transcriptional regulator / antitoxin HigA